MIDINHVFNFPKEARMNKRIPIKSIVKEWKLSKSDENLLRNHIDALYLMSVLDSDTTRLYSKQTELLMYEQILVFQVELKHQNKIVTLDRKLHTYFPNPTIFVYEMNDSFRVSTSDKRQNLNDVKLSVVEDVYLSSRIKTQSQYEELIKSLDYSINKYKDIYNLYQHYQNVVFRERFLTLFGKYPTKTIDITLAKSYIKIIEQLNTQMNKLVEEEKVVFSMSDKMAFHNDKAAIKRQIDENKNRLIKELY